MGGNHGALPVDLDQDLVRTCAHAPLASCLVVNSSSPARLAVTWLSPRQIVQTNQSRWQPYYNVEGGGGEGAPYRTTGASADPQEEDAIVGRDSYRLGATGWRPHS